MIGKQLGSAMAQRKNSPRQQNHSFEMMNSGTIAVATEMDDAEFSPDEGSGNESAPGSDQMEEQQSPEDSTGVGSVKAENADEESASADQAAPMPVQKRRRVTRACDECRRKKIKCDGKQPCTHCSVYSYGKMSLLFADPWKL